MNSFSNSLKCLSSLKIDLNNFVDLLESEKRVCCPLSLSVFDLLDSIDKFEKNIEVSL